MKIKKLKIKYGSYVPRRYVRAHDVKEIAIDARVVKAQRDAAFAAALSASVSWLVVSS